MTDIQTIKSRLRIEQVAARYGTLHKSGSNYTMLCPFHDDHHPSLMIHVGKQFFKCHACGVGGDVFTLVQQLENCSFREVIDKLVETRLALSTTTPKLTNIDKAGSANQERATGCSKRGKASLVSTRDNEEFLQMLLPYASGNAELSGTYLDFEVGMAPRLLPPKWKAFAGRIIFPIRDEMGELVGFAGREEKGGIKVKGEGLKAKDEELTLDPSSFSLDPSPKYLNSSSASGFRKGDILYGLFRAKAAIRETGRVFVVEGYKDLLAMHAAGLKETVALCGTALTANQLDMIRRLEADVWLVLDGDGPGREAAEKLQERFRQEGMEANTIHLPEEEDPDSLFRQFGRDGFERWMQQATSPLSPLEEELMALLLLLPQLSGHSGDVRLLFEKVAKWSDRLHITFFYEPYNRLFRQWLGCNLKETDPLAYLAPDMQTLAEELIFRYKDSIQQQIPLFRFVERLFILYAEKRLDSHIRTLSRRIRIKGTEVEAAVWSELHRLRIYFRFISRKLERPGAYGI